MFLCLLSVRDWVHQKSDLCHMKSKLATGDST